MIPFHSSIAVCRASLEAGAGMHLFDDAWSVTPQTPTPPDPNPTNQPSLSKEHNAAVEWFFAADNKQTISGIGALAQPGGELW